jgi:hypothetical protein
MEGYVSGWVWRLEDEDEDAHAQDGVQVRPMVS